MAIEERGDERIVPLMGVTNFREVGGYPARSGRQVRRGLIWRSSVLDRLTPADCERIAELGVHTVADLRSEIERTSRPTVPLFASTVSTLTWDHCSSSMPDQDVLLQLTAANDHHAAHMGMVQLYVGMAEMYAEHFRHLLQVIAEGSLPILIHCTAGKDRTGVAVALVLELLGVDRETVLDDYALSERLLDFSKLGDEAATGTGADSSWYTRMSSHAQKLMLRSDRAYLGAVLDHLDERYGSVEGFCVKRLQLEPATIDGLREALLEEAH